MTLNMMKKLMIHTMMTGYNRIRLSIYSKDRGSKFGSMFSDLAVRMSNFGTGVSIYGIRLSNFGIGLSISGIRMSNFGTRLPQSAVCLSGLPYIHDYSFSAKFGCQPDTASF